MRKSIMLVAASSLALLWVGRLAPAQSTGLAAPSPAAVTVVKAGRLLDPRTGNALSPAAVLIENGKIKEAGSPSRVQADAPAGVRTIDLGGATLCPA